MISFRPDYILASKSGYVYDGGHPRNLLPLYEHIARNAIAWNPEQLECLNNTSSINNYQLHGFVSMESVRDTLAVLFASAGSDSLHGKFLKACGIRTWKDLARPILLPGWDRDFRFPHAVRERKLKRSWNECHPKAIYGQCAYLRFEISGRWSFTVDYGYSHDGSTWHLNLAQADESLYSFSKRIVVWIEELFEPDAINGPHWRDCANREYDETCEAVSGVFYGDLSDCKEQLVASLLRLDGGGISARRITLDEKRLSVLRQWIRADQRKRRR